MDIAIMPKQSGKTTMLLHRMAADPNLYYIGPTHLSAVWTYKKSKDMGLDIPTERFLGPTDFRITAIAQSAMDARFVVDEVDAVLQALLHGARIDLGTLSPESPR